MATDFSLDKSALPSSSASLAATSIPSQLTTPDASNTASLVLNAPQTRLRYSIARVSSFSGTYHPQNVLYDRPLDLSSRWSGASVAAMPAGSGGSASSNTLLAAVAAASSSDASLANSNGNGSNSSTALGLTSAPRVARAAVSPAFTSGIIGSLNGTGAASSGGSGGRRQFIVLKLDRPAIVTTITFGKYCKPHPCNLRDFKIYGSMSLPDDSDFNEHEVQAGGTASEVASDTPFAAKENESGLGGGGWIRLLRGGLRNDTIPETFALRWRDSEGVPFPVKYIKLVPLAAYQPNYNFSVWHIALTGVQEGRILSQVCQEWGEYRELTTVRLILKHLRSRGHHSAFSALLKSSRLADQSQSTSPRPPSSSVIWRPFEHPLLTRLFDMLCRQGAWDEVERTMDEAARVDVESGRHATVTHTSTTSNPSQTLLSHYINSSTPRVNWTQLHPTDMEGNAPTKRGGHQMVYDTDKRVAYLFGGWDGHQDLCDLWAYHADSDAWRCISRDTRKQGGPGPRSCHTMTFDKRTGLFYVLGGLIDADMPRPSSHEASAVPAPSTAPATPSPGPVPSSATSGESSARSARAVFLPGAPPSNLQQIAVTSSSAANPDTNFVLNPAPTSYNANQAGRSRAEDSDELFTTGRGAATRLGVPAASSASSSPNLEATHSLSDATAQDRSSSPASASDSASRRPQATGQESELFCFSTRSERWTCLSSDTAAEGGPKLVYDHQTVIDSESQLLYVFGGRVVHPDPASLKLGGMWRYDVIQRKWTFLFDDDTVGTKILSRVGHSMLLDPNTAEGGGRQLWIFAGQRGDSYLASMHTYNLSTGAVHEIARDYSADGPDACFTQRASLNHVSREIYFFSGLTRAKVHGAPLRSSFWMYKIDEGRWTCLYRSGEDSGRILAPRLDLEADEAGDTTADSGGGAPPFADTAEDDMEVYSDEASASQAAVGVPGVLNSRSPEPRPRFSVQMVHDAERASFLFFGGNPADRKAPHERLDDFWRLDLARPSMGEVLRRAKFLVRQQRFLEMAAVARTATSAATGESPTLGGMGLAAMSALGYLQTDVSSVVDHADEAESTTFRRLMAHLLHPGEEPRGHGAREGQEGPSVASSAGEAAAAAPLHSNSVLTVPRVLSPLGQNNDASLTTLSSQSHRQGSDGTTGSDGLSADDGDSEMLSISQTLPGVDGRGEGNRTSSHRSQAGVGTEEGQPSDVYQQRVRLFRSLLTFFSPLASEPTALDLGDCAEFQMSRIGS